MARGSVNERTFRKWQEHPLWQAKLAKREAKREAVATEREVERTRLLEEGCDSALRAWIEIVSDTSAHPFARINAGSQLWALKLKLDAQAQQRTQGRIWELSFSSEVWE